MKGDSNKDLARENLKRISTSFELDLLRLIRTLNLISQSRELYKNQVEQLQQLTEKYKFGLSDFTIKLLDAERKLREGSPQQAQGESPYTTPAMRSSDTGPLIEVIDQFREYLNGIGEELERSKSLYVNKLDSIYSVYNLELGASQKDLDMKLLRLQKEITRITEANSADDKTTLEEDIDNITRVVKPAPETKSDKEKAPSDKTPYEKKDYGKPREPKPSINLNKTSPAEGAEKPAPNIKFSPDSLAGQTEEEPKVKRVYIAGAVLLIIGVIMGVVFYDILLKRWGVQEYADVEKIDLYTSAGTNGGNAGLSRETGKGVEEKPATEDYTVIPDDDISLLTDEHAIDGEKIIKAAPADVDVEEAPGDEGDEGIDTADTVTENGPEQTETSLLPVTEGDTTQAKIYTVKGRGANVRTGPGVNYDIVTVVRTGDELLATGGQHGHWITILAPDGKEGWVSGKIIKEVK